MNLALSDEQVLLREAARGALSRHKTLEAARSALDGDDDAFPDLWATACEASCTSNSSPCHATVAACGSMALWLWRGVR